MKFKNNIYMLVVGFLLTMLYSCSNGGIKLTHQSSVSYFSDQLFVFSGNSSFSDISSVSVKGEDGDALSEAGSSIRSNFPVSMVPRDEMRFSKMSIDKAVDGSTPNRYSIVF